MELGESAWAGSLRSVLRGAFPAADPMRGRPPHRPMLRTALAGLILGFGGVTAGTGLVHASDRGSLLDFFEQIFGGPHQQQGSVTRPEPRRRPQRYASLPDAHRVSATRQRAFTPRPLAERLPNGRGGRGPMSAPAAAHGPRTVCVRSCDGYLFPLGVLHAQKDLPVHQAACAAACPSAPTAVYILAPGTDGLDKAVSLAGRPYLAAAWANVYRQRRVENCHCHEPGLAPPPLAITDDPTLRVGDVVATGPSAGVVTRLAGGTVTMEDYRFSRGLARSGRRAVDQRVGALRRDVEERAFRRALRSVGRGPVRMVQASILPDASDRAAGFATIRVLVPSPFTP